MKRGFLALGVLALSLGFFLPNFSSAQKGEIKLKTFVHYPNPGRYLAPACTVSTSNPNDYAPTGWQMPTAGMDYYINLATKPSNLTNAQVTSAVTNSFATWTAADSSQKFTYAGQTSVKTAKYDGVNAILFKGISGGAIAITYTWYNSQTNEVLESDTAFNKNLKWAVNSYSSDCITSTSYDLQNIGTHEFGHWVGLDDLYASADKDLTMYGYGTVGELKKDTLGAGDISGVLAIQP